MEGHGVALLRRGPHQVRFTQDISFKLLSPQTTNLDSSRIYENAERARTCNSVVTSVPGMFASVNNSTDPTTNEIISYISNAGIPSIANQTIQYLEVITPYSVFPTILFNKSVGLAWWRNMLLGKKMQSKSFKPIPF
jgi:hypothetical protein